MPGSAIGTFEVKVAPVTGDSGQTVASGRLTLNKTYQGDLAGTGNGEMWTVDTSVEGSGGYVAIERFAGDLHGRHGAFVLLHQATMRHGGAYKLSLVVVPDSGTDQLEGLSGSMAIIIAKGKHSYDFDYSISESATPSTPPR